MERKPVNVTPSALKHDLSAGYIQNMWYDEACEGFEVRRLPPRETNIIAIRLIAQPGGTLEMLAEDKADEFLVFHAQIVPEGKVTSLIAEALELYGYA